MFRIGILLAIAFMVGCTSVRSTVVNRTEMDAYCKNSTIPVKGIPITLKVPTHVDVEIVEKLYLQNVGEADAVDLEIAKTNKRHLSLKATPVISEKIFTVDFVRPAAGTLEYGAELSDEQYFKSIKGKIVDETITEVTSTVEAITRLATASPTSVLDTFDDVIVVERTVAFRRFDVDAIDVEQQMLAFAQQHLNCCAETCMPGIH